MEQIKIEIEKILNEHLAKFPHAIEIRKECMGDEKYLKIWWSCSTTCINGVSGQMPQVVSFSLSEKLEFNPQIFGGNGGRRIYRNINPLVQSEKYYAMIGIDIPFRTPKPDMKKISLCLVKFINDYKRILRENMPLMRYTELCDYNYLLAE